MARGVMLGNFILIRPRWCASQHWVWALLAHLLLRNVTSNLFSASLCSFTLCNWTHLPPHILINSTLGNNTRVSNVFSTTSLRGFN